MSNSAGSHSNRIFGLDLLRFIAITFVIIEHGGRYLKPHITDINILKLFGYFGVELFFVLSGFLIGSIFIKIYQKENRLNFKLIKDFWIRRWFRTIPLYYLILTFDIIIHEFFGKSLRSLDYLSYYAFIQNAFSKQPNFFGEAWSLAIEEWFYLSLPIVLLLFDRMIFLPGKLKSVKNKILIGLISFFVIILITRIIVVLQFNPSWNDGIRKVMTLRLDSILIGVFFSWLNFYYKKFFNKNTQYLFYTGICLLFYSCYIFFKNIHHNADANFFTKTLYFTVTDLAFAFLLPFANNLKTIRFKRLSKLITQISITSYSIYLIHQSVVIKFLFLFGQPNSILSTVLFYTAYLGLTIVIAFWLNKYFEVPMTNLRERFSKEVPQKSMILKPAVQKEVVLD